MSRRGRALSFFALALLAAVAAAAIADRYGSRLAQGYGPLRPVVVVEARLEAGARIGPAETESALTVRRVPERFVPASALAAPPEALGLVAKTELPAGSYLLAAQLGLPRRQNSGALGLGGNRRAVEIAVGGAGALLTAGAASKGARVDVVVTSEPNGPGPGRTYIAAAAVPLLALRAAEGPAAGGTAAATLGLTRRQALRLIAAESFARRITLLPGG